MAEAHENKDRRRAAVAAALAQGGRLDYAARRALAQQFGCSPVTIYDDMIRAQTPAYATWRTGGAATIAPGAVAADRDIALLRLLGRLEFVTTAMLKALIAPDISLPSAARAAEPPPQRGPDLATDGHDGSGAAARGRRARPAAAQSPVACMA